MSSKKSSIVVVGDGWAALGLAGFLSRGETKVTWVSGTGSRIVSPLPSLETGFDEPGAQGWASLAAVMGIDTGPLTSGSFIREFRNKAFREPVWIKAPTPEDRREARNELLWEPERVLVPVFEARFAPTLAQIEEQLRDQLTGLEGDTKKVRRIEGVPLQSIQVSADRKIESVTLASGEVVACEQVFFADRWTGLGQIEGLPKGMAFTRKRSPVGVLQAVFAHDQPMAVGAQEGFFGTLHKEAGEDVERHVWGYFSSDGTKSYWTLCLSSDEAEDNHAIAKKLRRMKNQLDKMFVEGSSLPEGKKDFLSNVKTEQVRFEDSILFSEGEDPREAIEVENIEGLRFLTDGYGPTSAMRQVEIALRSVGAEGLLVAPAPSASEESESSEDRSAATDI